MDKLLDDMLFYVFQHGKQQVSKHVRMSDSAPVLLM